MRKIKKITGIFLCIVMLLSLLSSGFCVFAEGDEPVLGDIDGDGVIKTTDVREILKMAADIIPPDLSKADMNSDGVITTADALQALRIAVELEKYPEKTGDNLLSDDPNNEFISLIVKKYKVAAGSLVAIYAVPDKGNNFVLQFKSATCDKSPANLSKVYQIDINKNVKIATDSILGIGNEGCSVGEAILVVNLIKTKVMPQYPDYFVGV